MGEKHRIALPDGSHFDDLASPIRPGVTFVSIDGKEAYRITGGGLQEYVGRNAYITWYGEQIDPKTLDPKLTRKRD